MLKKLLKTLTASFEGEPILRQENCRICNEQTGIQIGVADYWDIKTCRIVRCEKCSHIQLDPMLNDDEISKGCLAYYIEESLRTNIKEQSLNCLRNFRRGVIFGYKLKKRNIQLHSVLELGPGSGYFAAGLQFVFPDLEITVMDINEDVLKFNKEHHNYEIIKGTPDNFVEACSGKFDLIIARDIIEHVTDISKVLININKYLKTNGFFHFTTPNGYGDVWRHYVTYKLTKSPSELLINHLNYFDGKGLKNLLIQNGLNPVDYYTYQIKSAIFGRGWKITPKLMAPVSKKLNADFFINEKANEVSNIVLNRNEILDKWYIQRKAKWITYLFSISQHFSILRISPELNIGHEIYGLFKKIKN